MAQLQNDYISEAEPPMIIASYINYDLKLPLLKAIGSDTLVTCNIRQSANILQRTLEAGKISTMTMF